jgi:high-affinity K+ transport system ATPase subunit B
LKVKPRSRTFVSTLFALLACGVFAASSAAQTSKAREGRANKSEAKISMKQARATALAKVPGGRIKSSELEREKGKLIYSFDIRPHTGTGIEEVNVDALTGEVLAVDHETPKHEASERRDERKESKRKKP